MGTTRISSFYRLLLPLLLALVLGPLAQAQEETRPLLRCQLEPDRVGASDEAQFALRLSNIGAELDLAQLVLTLNYTDPTLIVAPTAESWQSGELINFGFEQAESASGQIQITANRADSATLSVMDAVLARARIQALDRSGLVSFTLSAVNLRRPDGAEVEIRVEPACFLAIGDAELPTPTPTPTATLTVDSPVSTPTETLTPAPAETPSLPPTGTLAEVPTVPVVVVTPTPRLDELQSPLATPTPVAGPPGLLQTPDIALTLTAEAQAILLDTGDLLDTAVATPIPMLPSGLLLTPTATPPPMEVLSPPRLEEAIWSVAEEVGAVATLLEGIAQPANAGSALLEDSRALEPSSALGSSSIVEVETIQQPPAGILFQRSPLLFRIGWTTFIAAVVLVFTSWWLRRTQ
jgi:hypothetical protein